jgi:uncharacterized protein with FMN-binding domain
MKRAILIAGGTVGGLGAVLSVTPPQLGSNGLSTLSDASAATSSTPATAAVTTSAPAATAQAPAATTTSTKKSTAATTKKSTATKSTTTSSSSSNTSSNTNSSSTTSNATTAATPAAAAPKTPSGVSGSYTGDAFNVSYGTVQVKITVSNGRITDAVAVQAPSGRNQRWSDFAIPNLRSQTLSAQSAAITGASGASYTSYGWYRSLITALQKAGMPTGV